MIAGRIANLEAHRPVKSANLPTSAPVTQAAAASMLNVSERSVRDAKAIERDAPKLAQQVTA